MDGFHRTTKSYFAASGGAAPSPMQPEEMPPKVRRAFLNKWRFEMPRRYETLAAARRQRIHDRKCQDGEDLAGALCEMVTALISGRYGRYHILNGGTAAEGQHPGPGFDLDAMSRLTWNRDR